MWLAATRSSSSCGSGGPAEADCAAAGPGGASTAPSATSAPVAKRRRVSWIMASPAGERSGRRYGLAVAARRDREAVALARVGVGGPAGGRRRDRAEHRAAGRAVDDALGDEGLEGSG